MRRLTLFLLCVTSALAQDVTLTFRNGDNMTGTVVGGAQDVVQFSADFLEAPASLRSSGLLHWEQTEMAKPLPEGHAAEVRFNKGGVLYGSLVGLEADSVRLKTSYAGDLILPRAMIRTLTMSQRGRPVYQGPTPLSSWTGLEGVWTTGGASISSKGAATLARSVDFPQDRFSVQFSLEWQNSPQMAVLLLADSVETGDPENTFEFSIKGNRAILHKLLVDETGRQQRLQIGEHALPIFRDRLTRGEFRLDINRESGEVIFIFNKEVQAEWLDPDPARGTFGRGMILQSFNDPLQLSSLSVREWDGAVAQASTTLPLLLEMTEEQKEAGYQHITLRNGDVITGKVQSLDTEQVTISTLDGELEVPLSRMNSVALRALRENEYDEAIRLKGDVTGHYPDGQTLTFQIKSIEGLNALVFSQNFGETSIDLSVFSRVDFNLYDPVLIAKRKKT